VDAPALEGLLRQSTWFRTPLDQCVEIQEELSDGWTTRRVNGQNGG